ncbi:MAG: endonuclease/exonuclease/phosphatase family protein [Crocinitomicaceae bacterium]
MIKSILVILIIFSSFIGWSQSNDSTLSVLSWNIFLRPILNDNQKERVDSISDYLLHSQADVIIVQEAFHHKTRKRLIQNLSTEYPFHSNIGPQGFFRISSGVIIFTKTALLTEKHITFKKAKGIDGISKKGGVDVRLNSFDKSINIIGTHLQAGSGTKKDLIRASQYSQLNDTLTNPADVTIYCGDFNIRWNSSRYKHLLRTLSVYSDSITSDHKFTANFNDHDLFNAEGNPEWIDFILLKNDSQAHFIKTFIEEPRYQIDNKKARVSDHNPIRSIISLKSH